MLIILLLLSYNTVEVSRLVNRSYDQRVERRLNENRHRTYCIILYYKRVLYYILLFYRRRRWRYNNNNIILSHYTRRSHRTDGVRDVRRIFSENRFFIRNRKIAARTYIFASITYEDIIFFTSSTSSAAENSGFFSPFSFYRQQPFFSAVVFVVTFPPRIRRLSVTGGRSVARNTPNDTTLL